MKQKMKKVRDSIQSTFGPLVPLDCSQLQPWLYCYTLGYTITGLHNFVDTIVYECWYLWGPTTIRHCLFLLVFLFMFDNKISSARRICTLREIFFSFFILFVIWLKKTQMNSGTSHKTDDDYDLSGILVVEVW